MIHEKSAISLHSGTPWNKNFASQRQYYEQKMQDAQVKKITAKYVYNWKMWNQLLVYKLKKIVGSNNFSAQFIKIISHYKKIGYNINVLQQTACLVVNPITVGNFAFLFNCTLVGRTSDSMMVPT